MLPTRISVAILMSFHISAVVSLPINSENLDIIPLSPADAKLLAEWQEGDKQNIWELSGQFEGDIILSLDQKHGLINKTYRWPNNEIPYEMDSIFDDEQKAWILHSLTEYNNKTCIRPRPRTESDIDYIYVRGNPDGCYSYVGKLGGKQILNLKPSKPGTGCLRLGTIVHEFLHALGFYHQHSASERDDYVEIMWENIMTGKKHNFRKCNPNVTTSFGEKYDYGSIMHYSAYAFSKNSAKTIITKHADAVIGQRKGMSDTDVIKLNKMYNCTKL